MIRVFNKIQYYFNEECKCWQTNYSPSIWRMIMIMIIIIIPKYLAFEVLTIERIYLRKMRLSRPDYFEINWGNFVADLSSDKIYYTSLDVNIKKA